MYRHYAKDNKLMCIFDAFGNTELIIRVFAIGGMHDLSVKVEKDDSHLEKITEKLNGDYIPNFKEFPHLYNIAKFVVNNLDGDVKEEDIYKDDKIYKSKILITNTHDKIDITLQLNQDVCRRVFNKNDSFFLSKLNCFVNSMIGHLYYKKH